VSDANAGSARGLRAVFGRWPKTREREKRGLFGGPPNGTRGPRVLPRELRKHAFG
jgi:hypothetical protein